MGWMQGLLQCFARVAVGSLSGFLSLGISLCASVDLNGNAILIGSSFFPPFSL